MKHLSTRVIAANILNEVISAGRSFNTVLNEYLTQLPSKQHALIQELCYGTLRWYWQLNGIINMLLKHPLKEKDSDLKMLLLIGIYQLRYMRIPPHAAINETVNATHELKKSWASKLINGVLREYQRQQKSFVEKINSSPLLYYAHPKWLLKLLQQAWPNCWEDIAMANNQHPPMTLRVNRLKQSREDYLKKLSDLKIKAYPAEYTELGITLEKPCAVTQLPGFNEGFVSVQDAAAQLAADLLELQPELSVLDACAAPGGKTTHILETETHLKQFTILEIDSERMKKIAENLQRLGFIVDNKKIMLHCADANHPTHWWNKKHFDRILLDAPCSGTGVIRRHPDIKILRRSEDILNFCSQQLQLLNHLWPLLNKNGILLYATCSVLPQENMNIFTEFLTQHPDAQEKPIIAEWGVACEIGRQLFPQKNGHDGFYYAKFIKCH